MGEGELFIQPGRFSLVPVPVPVLSFLVLSVLVLSFLVLNISLFPIPIQFSNQRQL